MKIIPTVGILIIKNNKILLVKHGAASEHIVNSYGWPGGRFHEGETGKHAAARELQEETGLQTKGKDLEEFIHDMPPNDLKRKDGKVETFSVQLFVCKKYTGKLKATSETTPEWVPIPDLDKYSLLPNVKRIATILSQVL